VEKGSCEDRIHNIRGKNDERDLLYVQPTNPDLHEATAATIHG